MLTNRSRTLPHSRPGLVAERVAMRFTGLIAACSLVAGCNALLGIEGTQLGDDGGAGTGDGGNGGCMEDTECGEHEVCAADSCDCAPGYAADSEGCRWQGVVADPGFQDEGAWTVSGGSAVRPGSAGNVDAGDLHFDAAASCAMATATQTVEMPPLARAEPLVVEVVYRGGIGGFESEYPAAPAIGIDGRWLPLSRDYPDDPDSWETQRFCLGEAAYGGAVELGLSVNWPFPECSNGDTDGVLIVDRMDVVPAMAGECPVPGEVLGGDMEEDGIWQFHAPAGGLAGIIDAAGENGSRGARLQPNTCGSHLSASTMQSTISIPSALQAPALELWWSGLFQAAVDVRLQPPYIAARRTLGQDLVRLSGLSSAHTTRICLPAWSHGHALPISIAVGDVFPCDAEDQQVTIDNLRIVEDEACVDVDSVPDGGFERRAGTPAQDHLWPWRLWAQSMASAGFGNDAARAHDGAGFLRLSVARATHEAAGQTSFAVPRPGGGGGPSLRFWHDLSVDQASLEVRDTSGAFTETVTGTGWTEARVCLPPRLAGRPMSVAFKLEAFGASNTTFPEETAHIDDVSVGLDPACPAQ